MIKVMASSTAVLMFSLSAMAEDKLSAQIMSHLDAAKICPSVCISHQLKWNGNWRQLTPEESKRYSSQPDKVSFCGCGDKAVKASEPNAWDDWDSGWEG